MDRRAEFAKAVDQYLLEAGMWEDPMLTAKLIDLVDNTTPEGWLTDQEVVDLVGTIDIRHVHQWCMGYDVERRHLTRRADVERALRERRARQAKRGRITE